LTVALGNPGWLTLVIRVRSGTAVWRCWTCR